MIPPTIQKEIEKRLSDLEKKEHVKILFAIESGSRAWGFPSPDSDFDIRFVYVRPVNWYISLEPGRDVLTPPIEFPFDLDGWDIQKALILLLKPNAVLQEWLQSPIKYRWDENICNALSALAEETNFKTPATYHYLNHGQTHWKRNIENQSEVSLKKYFYVLRPALALNWLRTQKTFPPMNLTHLREGLNLTPNFENELDKFLKLKSQTKELGKGPRSEVFDSFILGEFSKAQPGKKPKLSKELQNRAQLLFEKIVLEQ